MKVFVTIFLCLQLANRGTCKLSDQMEDTTQHLMDLLYLIKEMPYKSTLSWHFDNIQSCANDFTYLWRIQRVQLLVATFWNVTKLSAMFEWLEDISLGRLLLDHTPCLKYMYIIKKTSILKDKLSKRYFIIFIPISLMVVI